MHASFPSLHQLAIKSQQGFRCAVPRRKTRLIILADDVSAHEYRLLSRGDKKLYRSRCLGRFSSSFAKCLSDLTLAPRV